MVERDLSAGVDRTRVRMTRSAVVLAGASLLAGAFLLVGRHSSLASALRDSTLPESARVVGGVDLDERAMTPLMFRRELPLRWHEKPMLFANASALYKSRVVGKALLAAIFCAALAAGVSGAATSTIPSAFARAPVASDQLPGNFQGVPDGGLAHDSRRIATLQGTKRSWSVYIFKQTIRNRLLNPSVRPNICLFIFTSGQGAGGGCSPTDLFFGPRHVSASATGRVLAGVASDRVARVVVVGSRRVVHEAPLSADQGFIFNCRAYNGCACVVSRVQAFDKSGKRIANQDWRSSARNCRRQ